MRPLIALLCLGFFVGCTADPCTVQQNADGTATISCPDGTSSVAANGIPAVTVIDTDVGSACDAYGHGGQRTRTGLDDGLPSGTARNGQLEDGEVDSTGVVCNGATGGNGYSFLALVDDVVGAYCDAHGGTGQRIRVGLDDGLPGGTAYSQQLEDEEVDKTTYVCNGATGQTGQTGFSSLMVVDEQVGTSCDAHGGTGQRIRVGLDDGLPGGTARNLALEDEEVQTTAVVCNGADGALFRLETEPPSVFCPSGGALNLTGRDLDSNGMLEDAEVQTATFSCPGFTACTTLAGGFVVSKDLDWLRLSASGCSAIEGNLEIANFVGGPPLALQAPLASVRTLYIHDNAVPVIHAPLGNLSTVTEYLVIQNNPGLAHPPQLPALVSAGKDVVITHNLALEDLQGLGVLASVGGTLVVQQNALLADFSGFGPVPSVVNLIVDANPSLKSLAGLDSLTSISQDLVVVHDGSLSSLQGLGALASVGRNLIIVNQESLQSLNGLDSLTTIGNDLLVANNPALVSLFSLNTLTAVGNALGVYSNPVLANLTGLDAVTSIGATLGIGGNTRLPECQAKAFADHMVAEHGFTGTVSIGGNWAGGTCP